MKDAGFLLRYAAILLFSLGIAFGIHCWLRIEYGLEVFGEALPGTYLFNFILAFGIVVLLYVFRQKLKNQIGFLFIAGSLLKFLGFFVFFYPGYASDGSLGRSEFAAFFVPYAVALILETLFASLLLRNMEKNTP
ncbi:DUF6168 family protein [Robiginitalea sp. IMCC43444]|uniref:DUF6168 family protein n=1 Tax=Robiginitalea sp. IMCC43444 TaxID=3459121 RepID=UPI0040437733